MGEESVITPEFPAVTPADNGGAASADIVSNENHSLLGGATSDTPADPSTEETKVQELSLEEYKELKFPEGAKLDESVLSSFKNEALRLKLDKDQAQGLVDFQANVLKMQAEASIAEFNQMKESWRTESKKELGADYASKLSGVAKIIDQYGSPELRQVLDDTGFGNHPQMVKLMVNLSKVLSPDTFVTGDTPKQELTREQKRYGTVS